jgi:hypothetical protein
MSNLTNMTNESNVAYTGTSGDLTLHMGNPLVRNGCDMALFSSGMDMALLADNNYDSGVNSLDAEADSYLTAVPILGNYDYNMSPQEATLELQRLSDPSVQMGQYPPSRATVSPQDLMLDWQSSAPPSSLIPELTPNSVAMSSPGTADDMDYPLFTNATTGITGSLFGGSSSSSSNSSNKQKSSSSANKVTKPCTKKRAAGNAPIEFDPNDPIDVKRAKNTGAARKSRQKKQTYLQGLEAQVKELQAELAASRAENEALKALKDKVSSPCSSSSPVVVQQEVHGRQEHVGEHGELGYLFEESAADDLMEFIG